MARVFDFVGGLALAVARVFVFVGGLIFAVGLAFDFDFDFDAVFAFDFASFAFAADFVVGFALVAARAFNAARTGDLAFGGLGFVPRLRAAGLRLMEVFVMCRVSGNDDVDIDGIPRGAAHANICELDNQREVILLRGLLDHGRWLARRDRRDRRL